MREIVTSIAGLMLIVFVGVDVINAGGVEWGTWTVVGYAVLSGIGLMLLHPRAGKWLVEHGEGLLPWGEER